MADRRRRGQDDERHLVRKLQRYIEEGINSEEGDVTEVRQSMFERYYGEAYGNERDGFSQYRSREVLEAVEWALPALLRVFLGGRKAVEFRASGSGDEDQAKHETDAVNYWFYDGNPEVSGFLTLYSWLKDILMYPNGYVTVTVREKEEEDTEYFDGVTAKEWHAIKADLIGDDEDYKPFIEREYEELVNGVPVKLFDMSIKRQKLERTIEVTPRAPDTVIIEHGHAMLDVDSARFVAIRDEYTKSELMDEFGYTEDELAEAGSANDDDKWNDERTTRLFYIDETPDGDSGENEDDEDRRYYRYECYVNVDWDGDGKAERRRVVLIGSKIFENEEDEYTPVVAASAIHVTHKHIGISLAETVADLQLLTTTLTRQLLDNVYKQNVRRTYINEQAITSDNATMDQMLDATEEVIEVRGSPYDNIMPEQTQPIVTEIAAVLASLADKPSKRTGVAPELTLDPSVLKESTMGAFMGAMDQASQRLELLARLFAETGLKRVFQKIHYLLRTHFDGVHDVKINDKWMPTQPNRWKKRSNMNVNVGLGFNNKQAMVQLLMTLLQVQRESMQAGLSNPEKIHNTLEQLIEHANMGHAGTYFVDPKTPEFKPPQPAEDPAMISAKAQAESLKRDADRRDKELDHKIRQDMAEQQRKLSEEDWKAVEWFYKLDSAEREHMKTVADVAEADARITKMNHEAAAAAAAPAEGSAEDEFSRASGRVSKPGGGGGQKEKEGLNGSGTA